MHLLGHGGESRRFLLSVVAQKVDGCGRLSTKLVSMRNSWEILSGNITCAIRSSVCCTHLLGPPRRLLTHLESLVASKCGFDVFGGDGNVTNSASHIKEYIEGTIERLGFAPDLYYLHRIDPSASRHLYCYFVY